MMKNDEVALATNAVCLIANDNVAGRRSTESAETPRTLELARNNGRARGSQGPRRTAWQGGPGKPVQRELLKLRFDQSNSVSGDLHQHD